MDNLQSQPLENFSADSKSTAASTLSASVFSNPTDFLNTLKHDLSRFSNADSGVTLAGLESYAKNATDDPKGQAAANIAIQHFNDLSQWQYDPLASATAPANRPVGDNVISPDIIQYDLSLEQDHSGSNAKFAMIMDGAMAVGSGAFAVGCGLGAVALAEAPPAAFMLAGFAGIGAAGAIASTRDLIAGAPGDIAAVANEQKMLASWPEINQAAG